MRSLIKLLAYAIVFVLGYTPFALAQSIGNSAYNVFGLGTLEQKGLIPYEHMGYTAIGSRMDDVVNIENPAALTSIRGFTHSLDFGLSFSHLQQQSSSEISTGTFGGLHDLSLYFRPNAKTGMVVGLSQYSEATYDILNTSLSATSTELTESRFIGDGGSSQAFVGFGYRLLPTLHLGIEGSLLFGSVRREEFITIPDPSAGIRIDRTESFIEPLLKFGLQNEYKLGESARVVLGAVYEAGGSSQLQLDEVITSSDLGQDSLFFESSSTLQLPQKMGFGVGLQLKSWDINLDYEFEAWGSNDSRERFDFKDRFIASAGVQYRKDRFSTQLINRIAFRLGGGVHSNYVAADAEEYLSQYFAAGMSVPILRGAASINLGYQFQSTGTSAGNLIEENVNTFSFSLTIRDVWFGKRMYD